MKNIEEIAFVIQARLSSKRTAEKMLRPFAGTTLLDIALDKVAACRSIPRSQFLLAVHEEELVRVGERHGVTVFRRSAASAASEGASLPELYEWWDRCGATYAVLINACAPFLRPETIDRFVDAYRRSSADGLFGVIAKRNYFWRDDGTMITPWPVGFQVMNTKVVDVTFEAAHCLYAGRTSAIGRGVWMGTFQGAEDPVLFPMDEVECLDIDHPWQFEMCEAWFSARRAASDGRTHGE